MSPRYFYGISLFFSDIMVETINMCRMEQICMYLLLVLSVVNSQCSRRPIIHTISYQNCQPKRILSHACAGTCSSHARPSASVPGEIEHFCECCKQAHYETRRTVLSCPSSDGLSLRRVMFRVNVPQSCSCRPCSSTPDHIIAADDHFQSGKRSAMSQVLTNEHSHKPKNAEHI